VESGTFTEKKLFWDREMDDFDFYSSDSKKALTNRKWYLIGGGK
jgi:hypothetical protein